MPYRAVVFDLGGVVFPSPFEAFDRYDHASGLEPGSVRALIRVSSEEGAWAALERGELTMHEFFLALEAEAEESGFRLDARELMSAIGGGMGARPEMVRAIGRIREAGLRVGALTNNWRMEGESTPHGMDALGFDTVVESALVGLRKPDPRIYELVLTQLGVDARDSVFLDDLGINLKPAREMGMHTIKVTTAAAALEQLADALGFPLD